MSKFGNDSATDDARASDSPEADERRSKLAAKAEKGLSEAARNGEESNEVNQVEKSRASSALEHLPNKLSRTAKAARQDDALRRVVGYLMMPIVCDVEHWLIYRSTHRTAVGV